MKIRGFRIELGEIEARLAEYDGIRKQWCWRGKIRRGQAAGGLLHRAWRQTGREQSSGEECLKREELRSI